MPEQLRDIVQPHEHDVLSGRGNYVNYHAGNEHFRALVKKHKVAYVACPKPQKGKFSRLIYDEIRAREPPGRFLKQDSSTKLWYDIGEKKALDKTRQALREGAPDIMKELAPEEEDSDSVGVSPGPPVKAPALMQVNNTMTPQQQLSPATSLHSMHHGSTGFISPPPFQNDLSPRHRTSYDPQFSNHVDPLMDSPTRLSPQRRMMPQVSMQGSMQCSMRPLTQQQSMPRQGGFHMQPQQTQSMMMQQQRQQVHQQLQQQVQQSHETQHGYEQQQQMQRQSQLAQHQQLQQLQQSRMMQAAELMGGRSNQPTPVAPQRSMMQNPSGLSHQVQHQTNQVRLPEMSALSAKLSQADYYRIRKSLEEETEEVAPLPQRKVNGRFGLEREGSEKSLQIDNVFSGKHTDHQNMTPQQRMNNSSKSAMSLSIGDIQETVTPSSPQDTNGDSLAPLFNSSLRFGEKSDGRRSHRTSRQPPRRMGSGDGSHSDVGLMNMSVASMGDRLSDFGEASIARMSESQVNMSFSSVFEDTERDLYVAR